MINSFIMKKKSILFAIVLTSIFTNAQNVGIGITTPVARLHVADSNVVFTGPATLPSSTTYAPPIEGPGTRMMWYPQKAAFRVGSVPGTGWNKMYIGNASFASGYGTIASGNYSTAMGANTGASGNYSTALGYWTSASGNFSIAMGNQAAALGNFSIAMGYQPNSTGDYSTATGLQTIASGEISTAMGFQTIAKAHTSTVIGAFNDVSDNPNSIVPQLTDRIFQIGNGDPVASTRNNAMTVLRNGNVGIGVLNPSYLLHLGNGALRVEGPSASGGTAFSIGGYGDVTVDKPGISAGRFIIKENGDIGIGTTTPNALLQFPNTAVNRKLVLYETANNDNQYYGFGINAGKLRYQVDGITSEHTFYAATGAGTSQYVFAVHGDGNIFAPGTFTSTSDARLKKNITPLGATLDKIKELNGYTYNWISPTKDQRQQIGLLAQEVHKLFPQLVTEFKGDNDELVLGINYLGLIPVLIEGLKEQQKQIDALQRSIDQLLKNKQ